MQFPRIGPTGILLGLLAVLMLSSVLYNRESLLFCERALYGELDMLRKETSLKGPIKFTEVCPEIRQRQETNLAKWLEVILALLVQWGHPSDKP